MSDDTKPEWLRYYLRRYHTLLLKRGVPHGTDPNAFQINMRLIDVARRLSPNRPSLALRNEAFATELELELTKMTGNKDGVSATG